MANEQAIQITDKGDRGMECLGRLNEISYAAQATFMKNAIYPKVINFTGTGGAGYPLSESNTDAIVVSSITSAAISQGSLKTRYAAGTHVNLRQRTAIARIETLGYVVSSDADMFTSKPWLAYAPVYVANDEADINKRYYKQNVRAYIITTGGTPTIYDGYIYARFAFDTNVLKATYYILDDTTKTYTQISSITSIDTDNSKFYIYDDDATEWTFDTGLDVYVDFWERRAYSGEEEVYYSILANAEVQSWIKDQEARFKKYVMGIFTPQAIVVASALEVSILKNTTDGEAVFTADDGWTTVTSNILNWAQWKGNPASDQSEDVAEVELEVLHGRYHKTNHTYEGIYEPMSVTGFEVGIDYARNTNANAKCVFTFEGHNFETYDDATYILSKTRIKTAFHYDGTSWESGYDACKPLTFSITGK